jgi:4-carboxymuconolactone decarboxylase
MVQNTTDVLFRDLWLRPDLAPRHRSLVTVSALIASGQVAQLAGHLNRAMDNGLTQGEAAIAGGEVNLHIGEEFARFNCKLRSCRPAWGSLCISRLRKQG